MPWNVNDVDRFRKGLSDDDKKRWVAIANNTLKECMAESENPDESACAGRAVKIANGTLLSHSFAELSSIRGMEVFRAGTHNGFKFTEDDLDEIADNFRNLKDEVRPKLKLTHREDQENIGSLASYGDITDCYTKKTEDGRRRLFVDVANVPKEVVDMINERRFPERSIELYPEFKLGTEESGRDYKNVLKAVALLGSEMPAVTGLAPVRMSETEKKFKTVCIGEVCFPCEEAAEDYQARILDFDMALYKAQQK